MYNDYIMRMIEQFMQVLASIALSRKGKNYDQSLELIQTASTKFLNEDISAFVQATPQQLIERFKLNSGYFDMERCIICAELLRELALIFKEKQISEGSHYLNMLSLHLFASVIPLDKHFQIKEYIDKATDLLNETRERSLPDDVQASVDKLQQFLEKKPSQTPLS